jgi:hypothetical protein
VTRDELQAAVLARSLTSDTVVAVTAINDAYKDIVNQAELNLKKATLNLVAGTDSYDLVTMAADFNGLMGVYYSGSDGSGILEPADMTVIIQQRAAFAQQAAPMMYDLIGFKQLELFPAPSLTGSTLIVWYYSFATADALSAAGSIPVLIPTEYHDTIELRASQMIASRYESAGENKGLSANIIAEYERRLGQLRANQRRHQSKQPRRLRTGYPRLPRIRPATPSTDVSGRPW